VVQHASAANTPQTLFSLLQVSSKLHSKLKQAGAKYTLTLQHNTQSVVWCLSWLPRHAALVKELLLLKDQPSQNNTPAGPAAAAGAAGIEAEPEVIQQTLAAAILLSRPAAVGAAPQAAQPLQLSRFAAEVHITTELLQALSAAELHTLQLRHLQLREQRSSSGRLSPGFCAAFGQLTHLRALDLCGAKVRPEISIQFSKLQALTSLRGMKLQASAAQHLPASLQHIEVVWMPAKKAATAPTAAAAAEPAEPSAVAAAGAAAAAASGGAAAAPSDAAPAPAAAAAAVQQRYLVDLSHLTALRELSWEAVHHRSAQPISMVVEVHPGLTALTSLTPLSAYGLEELHRAEVVAWRDEGLVVLRHIKRSGAQLRDLKLHFRNNGPVLFSKAALRRAKAVVRSQTGLTRLELLSDSVHAIFGSSNDVPVCEQLAGLKELQSLTVCLPDAPYEELLHLAGLTKLTHLDLDIKGDMDELAAVALVCGLKDLQRLRLVCRNFESQTALLPALGRCSGLRELSVEFCPLLRLSSGDLAHLSSLTQLTSLALHNKCRSRTALHQLVDGLPMLQVFSPCTDTS